MDRRHSARAAATLLGYVVALAACIGCGSSSPSVDVTVSPVDLGPADCGGESAAVSVSASNSVDAALSWSVAFEGPFATLGPTAGALAGIGTIDISVVARFPREIDAGSTISGALLLTTNDPAHALVRVPLSGIARGAQLQFQPTSFGDVPVSASSPAVPIMLQNTGNAPLDLDLGKPSRGDFIVVDGKAHLEPGSSASPTVRFSPTSAGSISATVPIVSKGPLCGAAKELALAGKGTLGVVLSSPGSLDFGLVACGTQASSKKVTVANAGDAPFAFTATLSNALYSVTPPGASVAPGGSVELEVVPSGIPATSAVLPDLYAGALTIVTTAPLDQPHIVDLHQTAFGAILTTTQPVLDAGSVVVDDVVTVPMGTVSNSGNASIVLNGAGTGGIAIAPIVIPAAASAAAAARFVLDPTVHPLANVVTETMALAASPVPLCAPPPLVTISVRPVDRAIEMDGNGKHLCVVGHTHRLYCVGENYYSEISPSVAAFELTVVAGANVDLVGCSMGSICFSKGAALTCRSVSYDPPNPIPPPWTTTLPANIVQIRGAQALTSGHYASYLVTLSTGAVYGIGPGSYGELGAGPPVSISAPGPTLAMGGISDVADAWLSSSHACVARAGGGVRCSGMHYDGRVSPGVVDGQTDVGLDVLGITDAVAVTVDREQSCALRSNHVVTCWGSTTLANNALRDFLFDAREIMANWGAVCSLGFAGTTGVSCRSDDATYSSYAPIPAGAHHLRPGLFTFTSHNDVFCVIRADAKVECGGGSVSALYPGFD
ncbi:hypothetical protein BH09MYX1_BH09MYX1_21200 [soil metagenome]